MRKAAEAGAKLRSLLRPDDTLHFFTSPYRRTRETTEGILNALTSDNPDPSPFPRNKIKVYEEPRLREQDFGNFQPGSEEMARMWQERADYGHFFYRIPNGESAADAYDRISGFNESLWRSFGEEDFASVCVLVTHGLMTRVFLMKWYHFSVEYFEDLRNVNHCEFVVMKLNPESGKFILQNQLRTWSQLQQEEMQAAAPPASPIPVRKRWGDWQDSCDAGGFERRQLQRRKNTADLFLDEAPTLSIEHADKQSATPAHSNLQDNPQAKPQTTSGATKSDATGVPVFPIDMRKRILSPATTKSIMNAGRDGGGSQSGAASEDDEENNPLLSTLHGTNSDRTTPQSAATTQARDKANANTSRAKAAGNPPPNSSKPKSTPTSSFSGNFPGMSSMAIALQGGFDRMTESGESPSRARADALGDQSDVDD